MLDSSDPVDSVVAAVRLVALVWLAWMTLSTAATALGTRPRFSSTFARKLVERALATAVLTGAAAAPAMALPQTEPLPIGVFVRDLPSSTEGAAEPARTGLESMVVAPGDNLWSISARHLSSRSSDPSPRDIASYWVKVVETNRATLRSGNPDLIYPGEVVALPPVD